MSTPTTRADQRGAGPDHAAVRARFPALAAADGLFLDNAGGAQVPQSVLDRTLEYFHSNYAQLGGSYSASQRAAATIDEARSFLRTFVGGDGIGEVVLGPSTSALCLMLARAHAETRSDELRARDRVIVCTSGHEANVGPWLRLEHAGLDVRTVGVRPVTGSAEGDREIDLDALASHLDERTRLVVVHHVSNLLGRIEDVRAIADRAHAVGAKLVVDGVAFAPHRVPDVDRLGVDWYVLSTYKVFGPHMAMLFGRREAFAGLVGPNHFFVDEDAVPGKFELGGVDHEACAGMLGVRDYLTWLGGGTDGGLRASLERAGETMRVLEQPALDRFADWLGRNGDRIRAIGPISADPTIRVPTFSFVPTGGLSSAQLATKANAEGLGIRFGHFYSHRLAVDELGLGDEDGVVRASLVHYNEPAEIDRLIDWLDARL